MIPQGRVIRESYHSLDSEVLDLLDGAGSPLLEGNTVHLDNQC